VNRIYGWFVRDVAANRRDTQTNVRAGYGEGRVLGSAAALAAKLVDRIGTRSGATCSAGADHRTGGSSADVTTFAALASLPGPIPRMDANRPTVRGTSVGDRAMLSERFLNSLSPGGQDG
jgi:hypothetical protein